ncbi:MAG: sirohydrochlorin cobaltochelatase [Hungatella hathewayi]|nr:sirohydrochlorin cobaltochelatase [Hungatella hathewayi]
MVGDEEGSWKSVFQSAGYDVVCRLKGLGELEGIRESFLEHAKMAVRSLTLK